jgi:hypothetical protein
MSPFARAAVRSAALAVFAASAAACGGHDPGMVTRDLSCQYDYLNERFGGLLYLFDLADETGHFAHDYAGGPVLHVEGDWDAATGDWSSVETWRAGYAAVSRTSSGNATFADDGDGSGTSTFSTTLADGTVNTNDTSFTRTGCSVTSMRTDDEGTVFNVVSENVALDEVAFTQTSTATSGVTGVVTGSNYLDWTSAVHVDRDDPTIAANPDYSEDRTGAADGSGAGDYQAFLMNGQYEEGSATYMTNGDTLRTWTRWTDSSMATVAAMGTTMLYQDGSGVANFVATNAMGVDTMCTRTWDVDQHGMLVCDDGTMQTF